LFKIGWKFDPAFNLRPLPFALRLFTSQYNLFLEDTTMKDIFDDARSRMTKAIESLESHLSVLRTGRANASMLNKVTMDLGLNPANKGDSLFITIPALTEERRKDLVKNAKNYAEEARVAVRNVRQDAMKSVKQLEKDKLASLDEVKRGEVEVQKITDEFIAKVEATFVKKEADILGS
jgi:ribosome recycling factor